MSVLHRFMLFLKTQSTEDFIESMIACFAAPVIAGLKCGHLINLSRSGECVPPVWLRVRCGILSRLSLDAVEISSTERSVLIFIYDRDLLLRALSSPDARNFLSGFGYDCTGNSVESHIDKLCERAGIGFPHEIGVFLGYPVEDVRGFIENGGRNSKLSGYWKVYGDEVRAREKFGQYKTAEINSARALMQRTRIKTPRQPAALSAA